MRNIYVFKRIDSSMIHINDSVSAAIQLMNVEKKYLSINILIILQVLIWAHIKETDYKWFRL